MRLELLGKLLADKLTALGKRRLEEQFKAVDELVQDYYSKINKSQLATLASVGELTGSYVAGVYDLALPTNNNFKVIASNILIEGAAVKSWWDRQASNTAFKFAAAVRLGIVQSETVDQVAKRVNAYLDVSVRDARTLVNTSIQSAANAGRLETFKHNADVLSYVQQISTFDGHTSDICISYSGAIWSLPDMEPSQGNTLPFNGGPPRHFNCRSVLVPITRLRSVAGKRASEFGPIDKSTTFEQFLDRKTQAQQDEMLGKGRAKLWRDGKITLRDLLDQSGNPLSLEQLTTKYG